LDERFVGIFYGHFAGNLDMLRRMGDQMPGSSGEAVEEQFHAEARRDIPTSRKAWRLPIVVAKLPVSAWRRRRQLQRLRDEVDAWWKHAVTLEPASPSDLRAWLGEARRYLLTT